MPSIQLSLVVSQTNHEQNLTIQKYQVNQLEVVMYTVRNIAFIP